MFVVDPLADWPPILSGDVRDGRRIRVVRLEKSISIATPDRRLVESDQIVGVRQSIFKPSWQMTPEPCKRDTEASFKLRGLHLVLFTHTFTPGRPGSTNVGGKICSVINPEFEFRDSTLLGQDSDCRPNGEVGHQEPNKSTGSGTQNNRDQIHQHEYRGLELPTEHVATIWP